MKQVIIIGAGASGLAAASRLVKNGVKPIQLTILEAQNRIGGRIHTVPRNDFVVEMGANWVHGEEGNVVHELGAAAGELNTDIHTLQSSGLGDDVDFGFEDSSRITKEQHQEAFVLFEEIRELADKELPGSDIKSFGEYFKKKFSEKVNQGALAGVDRGTASALLEWYHVLQNIIDGSEDWMETCGPGHVLYRECPGDPIVTWKRGYSVLFDLLMTGIPKGRNGLELPLAERIQLNKAVCRIEWNRGDQSVPVNVSCQDGSTYECDYVLVTCPLGFLKENADKIFAPQLPAKKRKAIEALGFGTVDKIFLRFEEPWWGPEWGGISFLVRQDGHAPPDGWSEKIQGFYTVRKQPDMLIGWITGAAARLFESLPEAEVLRTCSDRLRKYLGTQFQYKEPVELIRTTWFSNPFTRGSYSYRAVKSKEQDAWAADLAEPVKDSASYPRLYFAGEATHDSFYSTVHGAVESGWREADRIAPLLLGENPKSRL